MIRRQGEYYICEQEEPHQGEPQPAQQPDREFSSVGDIKERLALMRDRLAAIRSLRAAQQPPPLRLSGVYQERAEAVEDYLVNLSIPSELLSLEERIERVEERVSFSEVQRQGVERGGPVVERVRRLQRKLEEMLKSKSVEVVNQNISQYSANLDEKEENFKQLYLYEIFTRTQGLAAEIETLEKYLASLGAVQRTVHALLPLPALLAAHNDLLARQQQLALRSSRLFAAMRAEYAGLLGELEGLE